MALEFNDGNFREKVLESPIPVLVDFWAPWCGPCRMVGPTIEALAQDYEGRARVGKVNVDENPQIAASYGVMSIPTLIVFKGGAEVDRQIGAVGRDQLAALLDQALQS
ncbi:MAG TPA: thioredoxin [bacterium]|nr:thioredoxin [bacterium]HPQ65427.1 thioredoxin [bacterium]